MRTFYSFFLLAMFLFAGAAQAQILKDNSKITYEARKKSGNRYELIIHMQLEKGWHVYSKSDDAGLIAAHVSFASNPKVKLIGGVKEKGKLKSEKVEGVNGVVNTYEGRVDYIQEVTATNSTVITGTYEYQICNDRTCLPPSSKEFKIFIRG